MNNLACRAAPTPTPLALRSGLPRTAKSRRCWRRSDGQTRYSNTHRALRLAGRAGPALTGCPKWKSIGFYDRRKATYERPGG
jgi:hypothetical protein